MVRRRKRSFRRSPRFFRKSYRKKMTIPLAPVVGFAGTILGGEMIPAIQNGNVVEMAKWLKYNLTGVYPEGNFNFQGLIQNWTPTIIGMGVHIAANKFGLNRMLANAKVPYVRV